MSSMDQSDSHKPMALMFYESVMTKYMQSLRTRNTEDKDYRIVSGSEGGWRGRDRCISCHSSTVTARPGKMLKYHEGGTDAQLAGQNRTMKGNKGARVLRKTAREGGRLEAYHGGGLLASQAYSLVQQLGHLLVVGMVLPSGPAGNEAIVLQLGDVLLGEALHAHTDMRVTAAASWAEDAGVSQAC